jgi:hypothetical protein
VVLWCTVRSRFVLKPADGSMAALTPVYAKTELRDVAFGAGINLPATH